MKRIGVLLVVLGLLLVSGMGMLVARTLASIETEETMRHEMVAARVHDELERELTELLEREEERSFLEYRTFYVPETQLPGSLGLSLSPLAAEPTDDFVVGWFQLEPDGALQLPWRPRPGDLELATDNDWKLPEPGDRSGDDDVIERLTLGLRTALEDEYDPVESTLEPSFGEIDGNLPVGDSPVVSPPPERRPTTRRKEADARPKAQPAAKDPAPRKEELDLIEAPTSAPAVSSTTTADLSATLDEDAPQTQAPASSPAPLQAGSAVSDLPEESDDEDDVEEEREYAPEPPAESVQATGGVRVSTRRPQGPKKTKKKPASSEKDYLEELNKGGSSRAGRRSRSGAYSSGNMDVFQRDGAAASKAEAPADDEQALAQLDAPDEGERDADGFGDSGGAPSAAGGELAANDPAGDEVAFRLDDSDFDDDSVAVSGLEGAESLSGAGGYGTLGSTDTGTTSSGAGERSGGGLAPIGEDTSGRFEAEQARREAEASPVAAIEEPTPSMAPPANERQQAPEDEHRTAEDSRDEGRVTLGLDASEPSKSDDSLARQVEVSTPDGGAAPVLESTPEPTPAPVVQPRTAPPRRQREPNRGRDDKNNAVSSGKSIEEQGEEPTALPPPDIEVVVEPFEGLRADAEHLVLHRRVTVGSEHYVQGLVLRLPELTEHLYGEVLAGTELDSVVSLSWDGVAGSPLEPLAPDTYRFEHLFGEPFDTLATVASLRRLPREGRNPRGQVLLLALLVAGVAILGLGALYRMVAVIVHFAERRNNFVSAVSHELKTPLTAIRMYGEILRDGMVPSEERRQEYYETITTESERLSRLINNVLELSRLEKGTRTMATEAGNVVPLVEEVARLLGAHARERGFQIVVEAEDDVLAVKFDRDALLQVLINLVDNAIKFSRNSESRTVVVQVVRDGNGAVLRVRDSGPGVPPVQLRRIFQPFFRGERELTRSTKGTGIGLALVKGLVEQMGGSVFARNHPAGGFEVSVALQTPV